MSDELTTIEATPDIALVANPQTGIERLKTMVEPLVAKRVTTLEAEIAPLLDRAKLAAAPATKADADSLGVLRAEIVQKKKAIEAERLTTTRPLDAFKSWIMAKIAPITGDLEKAEVALTEHIKVFQAAERAKAEAVAEATRQQLVAEARARAAEEEAARKAEADRKAAEAKAEADRQAEIARKAAEADAARRAEEAKIAAEKAAAAAKDAAEAQRIRKAAELLAAAEAEVAAEETAAAEAEAKRKADLVAQWDAEEAAEEAAAAQARLDADLAAAGAVVKVELAKIAGTSTAEHWTFEVVDEALVPREYLSVDEKKIRMAINRAGAREIAGVRVFRDDTIRSR